MEPEPWLREPQDKMLAGVCAGLARKMGWDVGAVRIAWVLAALISIGLIAYIVAWIVLPLRNE